VNDARDLPSMLARVAVVGASCAGKTTFARELATLLSAPCTELDELYWQKDWRPREMEEFRRLVQEAVSRECWVADGNYGIVRDLVWSQATSVVWLDYSFRLTFGRALIRTVRRCIRREELFSGNRESFRKSFLSRDSILLWVVSSFRGRRRELTEIIQSDQFPGIRFYRFETPEDAEVFLSQIRAGAAVGLAEAQAS